MMRGDIDVLQDVGRDTVEFVEAESSVQVYRFLRPYYYPLVFNVQNPLLKSKEVRQALSQAVDRQTIVAKAMHGRGRVADGPIWPFHWAHSEAQRKYAYNPEAARLRLEAAGLTVNRDPQPDACRADCDSRVFSSRRNRRYDRIALYLQKQFAEIGVDMQIQPVSISDFGARVNTGQFDAFLMETRQRPVAHLDVHLLALERRVPPHRLHGCRRARSTACASPSSDDQTRDRRRRAAAGLLRRSAGDLHRLAGGRPSGTEHVRSAGRLQSRRHGHARGAGRQSTVLMRASR